MHRIFILFTAVVLLLQHNVTAQETHGLSPKQLLEEFKKIETRTGKEKFLFLNQLREEGNKAALLEIARSNADWSGTAAGEYVTLVPTETALQFVTSLELESTAWAYGFATLDKHPKEKIIGYVKQMATSNFANVRYACYNMCRRNKWPELVYQARKDIGNDEGIVVVNTPIGMHTIGLTAEAYLESLK